MANDNLKIDAPVHVFDTFADILGKSNPAEYTRMVGNPFASSNPFTSMVQANQPTRALPSIQGLNNSLQLRPYGSMPSADAKQPSPTDFSVANVGMRQGLGIKVPPVAPNPTEVPKSFLGKVGSVLGKVGEDIGIATLGNERLSQFPGTRQYKEREEGLERQKEQFATGQDAEKAKAEYERAEAAKDLRGEAPDKTTEQLMEEFDKSYPGDKNDPEYQRMRAEYGLTKKLPGEGKGFERVEVQGPNGQAIIADYDPVKGKVYGTDGKEIVGAVPATKPSVEKENKAVAGTVGGSPAWGVQTEKGWVDPQTGASLPGFKPPPNYAEQPPPEFSPVVVIGSDGTPQTLGFNKRTNQVSAPNIQGGGTMLAPGQVGAQQYQATVIENAGSNLLNDIKANKGKLGNVGAIINSAFLGTPLSKPDESRLAAEIASFAALQPRLHGFRGQEAMREFEKMMGGLPNNPDSLAEAINGMLKTAGAVQGRVGDKAAGGPNVIGSDEHFNEWLKSRGK